MKQLIQSHHPILVEEARQALAETPVFGLESPTCDAFVYRYEDQPCIMVFDGLLYLLRYYVDLQQLLALLAPLEDEIEVGGQTIGLGLACSLAGHVIFVSCIKNATLPADIGHVLGPNATRRAEYGYGAAALFYVLHELGHIQCGHLGVRWRILSERVQLQMRVPEDMIEAQRLELEADEYALRHFVPEVRGSIISSVMFAMLPFAFVESFQGRLDREHPLTVNRLAQLAKKVEFSEEPHLAATVMDIVDSAVKRYGRLSDLRSTSGGDASFRIEETMSVPEAYQLMKAVLQRVKSSNRLLDFENV